MVKETFNKKGSSVCYCGQIMADESDLSIAVLLHLPSISSGAAVKQCTVSLEGL